MRKKVGLIGNRGNGELIGGQITKTGEVFEYLKNQYGDINEINVYGKKKCILIINVIKVMSRSNNVVIILATPGYFKILPFVIFLKKIFSCTVHEIVIGGVRHEYLKTDVKKLWLEKRIDYIYLESTHLVNMYKNIGFSNCVYLPNFKNFNSIKIKPRKSPQRLIKLCTFSRIDKNKGIDTAVEIILNLNKYCMEKKFLLDIYGPIDEKYQDEFKKIISCSNVTYMGVVNTKASQDTLCKYDILLFPTHWKAEGFPSTFIDAMSAGLPIIASDKDNFKDVIVNGVNGYLVEEYDIEMYCKFIIELVSDEKIFIQFKRNSLKMAEKYKTRNVLSKLVI